MANPEHVEIVKKGAEAIDEWLQGAIAKSIDNVELDLSRANLSGADLSGADLTGANLSRASLWEANLSGANLIEADLTRADLTGADLTGADLIGANLWEANLSRADLSRADLRGAECYSTSFICVDLSETNNLDEVMHFGPSSIGLDTLAKSNGNIPKEFLRGCGLEPWEVLMARLYDNALSASQVNEIQYEIFADRTERAFSISGTFISYAWGDKQDDFNDSKFVEKLRTQLYEKGLNVWLDRHDMKAGDMAKQVDRAIRLNDVVVIVLSKWSVESDWVEHELETARKKEKADKRDVLCPVALDDSWKSKVDGDPLWRQLKKKLVVDFSKWKTKAFNDAFQTLLDGLKTNY